MYISPADNQRWKVTKYIYSRDLLKYTFEVLHEYLHFSATVRRQILHFYF